jgi:Cu/Zn superoxide dismutase
MSGAVHDRRARTSIQPASVTGFSFRRSPLGDLPNIDTPAADKLRLSFAAWPGTIRGANAILDSDGAAIVIHSSRDNYRTDPRRFGSRIACGVITLK